MKKLFFYSLILFMTGTAVFSILGYFGEHNWKFDLFSHFKLQYFIILTLGTGILFFLKKRVSFIFLPFILMLIFELHGIYHGGNKNIELEGTTKIACINLLSSNSRFDDVGNYINNLSPDILVLQEFNTLWQLKLEPKLKEYKYRLEIPRMDNFGIAIYSKIDFSNLKKLEIGNAGVPSIQAVFNIRDTPITLIATHPLPPVDVNHFKNRNMQLEALSKHISNLKTEVVLIGDLNTSSFSNHFKKLISNSKLIDSRRGFGIQTTWPTWLSLVRTTLDHCLITDGIEVKSRVVGEDIGSDHLPIFVELGIKKSIQHGM